MRGLALLLMILVPTVASAQAVAPAAIAVSAETPYDVLPPVANSEFPWMGIAAYGLVLGFMIFLGVAGEDLGIGFCEGTLLAFAVGAVATLLYAGVSQCTAAPSETVVQYSTDGLVAFAADELTNVQRAQMAEVAQARGRDGVVLQRVVETRAGVGEAPGAYALEVAVVDAGTAQFRPLVSDVLAPQAVLSVSFEGSIEGLEAAQAEAFERLGIDA